MSNEHITDERADFETVMRRRLGWRDSDFARMPVPQEHEYNLLLVSGAFEGWKAALRTAAQPTQTWDANQIAMACAQAEISDSHCQSLLIQLEESNKD